MKEKYEGPISHFYIGDTTDKEEFCSYRLILKQGKRIRIPFLKYIKKDVVYCRYKKLLICVNKSGYEDFDVYVVGRCFLNIFVLGHSFNEYKQHSIFKRETFRIYDTVSCEWNVEESKRGAFYDFLHSLVEKEKREYEREKKKEQRFLKSLDAMSRSDKKR